jgi:hypothetical protein
MKVLGELCQCRLCSSSGSKGPQGYWHPCGCPIGREAEDHYVEWLPAKRVGEEIIGWYGHPVEVIARFPASVHGCWKVACRQELVVLRRKKK